jgi:hypothetical protein
MVINSERTVSEDWHKSSGCGPKATDATIFEIPDAFPSSLKNREWFLRSGVIRYQMRHFQGGKIFHDESFLSFGPG